MPPGQHVPPCRQISKLSAFTRKAGLACGPLTLLVLASASRSPLYDETYFWEARQNFRVSDQGDLTTRAGNVWH